MKKRYNTIFTRYARDLHAQSLNPVLDHLEIRPPSAELRRQIILSGQDFVPCREAFRYPTSVTKPGKRNGPLPREALALIAEGRF